MAYQSGVPAVVAVKSRTMLCIYMIDYRIMLVKTGVTEYLAGELYMMPFYQGDGEKRIAFWKV